MQDCADRWGPLDMVVSGAAGFFLARAASQSTSRRCSRSPEAAARLTRIIPLGHYGETADLAVFLASDAARNITGALIASDGGQAVGSGEIQL